MKIGQVERDAGLPAKTIRYYEDIGLIRPGRTTNGYRRFSERDLHKLRFLKRSRSLGFTIAECRVLLSLYEDNGRASADVKTIASRHLARIDRKIEELQSLRKALNELIETCHGDHRPDCPILDELAANAQVRSRS